MKKWICLFLCLTLLFLTGCGIFSEKHVNFYYVRDPGTFIYGDAEGVVTFEERKASGKDEDLKYLLTLYLQGPVSENLQSPFPQGTTLEGLVPGQEELRVILNDAISQLQGMDRTLACVCLARTCVELTDAERIIIQIRGDDGLVSDFETLTAASLLIQEVIPSETTK